MPIKWMYQGVTGFRNWMYDHRLRRAHAVSAKVISVANVTVGGTGKTPVTLALIEVLKEKVILWRGPRVATSAARREFIRRNGPFGGGGIW